MTDDYAELLRHLRLLSRGKHDDVSIAADAADAIIALLDERDVLLARLDVLLARLDIHQDTDGGQSDEIDRLQMALDIAQLDLKRARAEVDELAKDAERYRWLRYHAADVWYGDELIELIDTGRGALDSAIDIEMAGREGEG